MIEVLLRSLLVRKARVVSTVAAVILGVALVSGTFVLMDTVMAAYARIFDAAYVNTDAVVVPQAPFGATGASKPTVSASLLDDINALPEVEQAHGYIDAKAQLTDDAGVLLDDTTEEANVLGIPTAELDAMNPLTLISGAWPTGEGEIAVDAATARANDIGIGSRVGLVARQPLQTFRVVGTFRFADATTLGPVQFLALDLPVAQRVFDKPDMLDEIDVAAGDGVTVDALVEALAAALPDTAKVTTATDWSSTSTAEVGKEYDLVRFALLAAAAIVLLVASFIIFNTQSLTVAQRTRELATLRVLGASRRQVLGSILFEGAIIGTAGSVVGCALGLALADGLEALFAAAGVDLPSAGTVLQWRTVAISVLAGVAVSMAASVVPAVRALRIEPITAIRDVAASSGPRRRRGLLASSVVAGLGLTALVPALLLDDLSTATRLALVGIASVGIFAGAAGPARWAVPKLAAVIGRPLEPLTGPTGELAREEVANNPGRTATTATALIMSVALVAFVTVVTDGLRESLGSAIRDQVNADYVVTSGHGLLPPAVRETLDTAGIASAGVRSGNVHVLGSNQTLTGVAPDDLAAFWHLTWADGSPDGLASLDDSSAIVASDFADEHDLAPGSALSILTPTGATLDLTVTGVYDAPGLAPLLGAVTTTTQRFDRGFATPGDAAVYVDIGQPDADGGSAITDVLRGFTTAEVLTLDEFIGTQSTSIDTLVGMFEGLLALCGVLSLFSIANTLSLSITERRRELGTLRAVGMTRRQLRAMIRIESELIAVIGTLVGIVAGLVMAALTAQALATWSVGFTIPWLTLGVLLVVGVAAGTLAGIGPARRAARIDPLTALAYE